MRFRVQTWAQTLYIVTYISGSFLQLLETNTGSVSRIRQQSHPVPSVLLHVRNPYVIRHRASEVQFPSVNHKWLDELRETNINSILYSLFRAS